MSAIAEALSVNQSLEELDLRNNKIGPQTATQLAHALKHNTYLRRLDLRWNHIGVVGGRALLDLLKWNKTLVYLDVTGNDVSDDVMKAMELALERNREQFRTQQETSVRSQFLSATLQKMTAEHEEVIQGMREKLVSQETTAQALNQKLGKASEEMNRSHMAYRVLENKLTEERAHKEMYEDLFMLSCLINV